MMHGDVLVIVLLLVCGAAAFLFGVIYLAVQVLAGLGRATMRMLGCCRPAASTRSPRSVTRRVCPNPRCRKVEYRNAAFCSQCGTPLSPRGAACFKPARTPENRDVRTD